MIDMISPVSTTDAGIAVRLLNEMEASVAQINNMEGIRNNTSEPVHSELFKIKQACDAIRTRIGTGRG